MDDDIHPENRTEKWFLDEAILRVSEPFKSIEFIDRDYGYVHPLSFESVIDDMTDYCKRKGGQLE